MRRFLYKHSAPHTSNFGIKKAPQIGEALMFSLRNNPYCELLSKFVIANIMTYLKRSCFN